MVRFAQATAAVTAVAFVALLLLGRTDERGRHVSQPAAAMLPAEEADTCAADGNASPARGDAPALPTPSQREDAPAAKTIDARPGAQAEPDATEPSSEPAAGSAEPGSERRTVAPSDAAPGTGEPTERDRPDLSDLLAAMRHVESRGDNRAVGDGGRSRGPYQISLPYWVDGGGRRSRYWRDVWSPWASRRVILGYWRRYCPAALERGDLQTLARVHNGGPDGARERKTLRYWRRVREAMRDL